MSFLELLELFSSEMKMARYTDFTSKSICFLQSLHFGLCLRVICLEILRVAVKVKIAFVQMKLILIPFEMGNSFFT